MVGEGTVSCQNWTSCFLSCSWYSGKKVLVLRAFLQTGLSLILGF